MRSVDSQDARAPNFSDKGFHIGGIHHGREVSTEAEKDRAVGGVPDSGQRQRPIQIDLHPSDSTETGDLLVFREVLSERPGSRHRPHGVRA